ncbi:TlpA family protein disulfide reductase [Puteibacter caeruleilacunae]|nr:TlpA family protein disulfide reductase [Puteibacter caeruleilacunae]
MDIRIRKKMMNRMDISVLCRWFVLVTGIIAVSSCGNVTEKKDNPIEEAKEIVVIFRNPVPLKKAFKLKFGGEVLVNSPDFSFYDGLKLRPFAPDTNKINDTLCFSTANELILKYKYKVLSSLYYRFQPGDSILINYSDSIIDVSISNRKVSKYEANFDLEARNKLMPGQTYSFLDKYYQPFPFMTDLGKNVAQKKRVDKERYFDSAINYFEKEKYLLDSLKQQGLILESGYKFYHKKNQYLKNALLLNDGKLGKPETDKLIRDYTDSLYLTEPFFYRSLMHQVVYLRCVEVTENIDLGNTVVKNYKNGFDNIVNDSLLNGNLKKNSLKGMVMRIGQYFSKEELKQYLDKYAEMYADTSFVDHLKKQYLLEFTNETRQKDSLILIDNKGTKHTLAEIIAKHKDKVLYIDFWASWCAPCRQMLPYSHTVQNEFKNKGVAFIYLSMDKNRQQWLQAVKDEEMENQPESYMIINAQASEYIKGLQIRSIPRYLLYNRDGVLVNKNAPSPKSVELPKTITKLLSEKKG